MYGLKLQMYLVDSLIKWSIDNEFPFNISKC